VDVTDTLTASSGSDLAVSSVRAVPVAIPLESPLRFSTRAVSAREYVLVFVTTKVGLEGFGYSYIGTAGARSAALFVEEVLTPHVVGVDVSGPAHRWERLYQETLLLGRRGIAVRALSALDIACWDVLSTAAELPLHRMLGGDGDRVPAYASGGYYRPGDPVENVERELSRHLERGFRDVKIKVGGAPIEVDVARVQAARAVLGPRLRLALDANNAWKTPREAIAFGRAVERFDPWWLEEPLSPDDIAGHAEVARALSFPVATGEIHATRWEFRDLIACGSAGILQPDANVVGGISEWMTIAHAAATFNLPVAPHWNANVHVHLAAAVPNCVTVEYFAPDQDIFNFERLVAEPLRYEDGALLLPRRPGLGIVLDQAAVQRYAIR
jgi:L-alanine-DL-glutamate epimerase-like enolase superfamily enzyme